MLTPKALADALDDIANLPKEHGEPWLYDRQIDTVRAASDFIRRHEPTAPTGLAAEFAALAEAVATASDASRPSNAARLGEWVVQHRTALTRALASTQEARNAVLDEAIAAVKATGNHERQVNAIRALKRTEEKDKVG